MPPIRLEATGDLAGNWLDLADVWTRAEMREWYAGSLAGNDAIWLPLLERKLVGVHVYTAGGELLETAPALTARLDDLDMRLVRWLVTGVIAALQELVALGEASRRLLFAGVEVAQPKTRTTLTT